MSNPDRLTTELAQHGITDFQTPPSPEAWQACLEWLQSLLAERELAHSLFEQSQDAIVQVGPGGIIQRANSMALQMIGATSPEQVIGHKAEEFYADSEQKDYLYRRQQLWSGERMEPYVRRFRKLDGTEIDYEVNVQPIWGIDGNIIYTQSIMRDISARQQAEAQALKFRDRLKALNQITLVLARTGSVDDLLQQAVQLGHERLGIDRLSLWLVNDQGDKLTGTYGIDENSNLRDEHSESFTFDMSIFDHQELPISYDVDSKLFDHQGKEVGHGWSLNVLIRDMDKPVGMLCTDNLLRQEPMSAELQELITLYSATLGNLIVRKQNELARQISETRYRQMFELHQLPKLIVNPNNGQLVDANPAAADYYGFSVEQLRTMNIMDVNLSPQEEVQTKMAKARQTKMLQCRFVHRNAQQQPREVEVFTGPIDIDGEELLYSVVTDITEKEEVKAALEEAINQLEQRVRERTAELEEERNLLRTVMDALPAFIYVKDLQHRTVLNNKAHLSLMKAKSAQDVYGKTDFELFPAAIAERFQAEDDALFAARMPILNHEECFTRSNGSLRWLSTTKVPLYNIHQELTGLVGISYDITDRKRTEAERISLSDRLQLAKDTAQIGIWDWDLKTDNLVWDDRMLELYGISREQFPEKGTGIWAVIRLHPDDQERVYRNWLDAISGERPLDTEFRIIHKDGSVHYSRLRAVIFRDEDGTASRILGVNWDITLLKQAAEEMQIALKKESELSELKSRFVTMASHEFRTPLTAILATTETLTQYRDRMPPEQVSERLDRIRQHVLTMKGIIDDVLNLAQIQAGRMKFDPAAGDVDSLCRIIIEELESHPEYRGRVIYNCPQKPLHATFDKRLLRHLISNLGSNALKYSPNGNPITIDLTQTADQFILQVRDTGIGIPQEDMARLYEPFHRASNVGTISGTGMGLTISKQAVELHGGRIEFESQAGIGTTFTVILPKHLPTITRA